MTAGQSYAALDLHSHRRKMLRFVWIVMGALLVTAFAVPQVIPGREPLFPIQVQAIFLGYLIVCYVISRWHQFFWLAPHMLLTGLLVMLALVCFRLDGINTPASHFIAVIPALCALTMPSHAAIFHAILASFSIAVITIVEPGFQIRNASTVDLLNAATLILSSVIIATGTIYISRHQERLIKVFRGKSSFDELTGLPNRYLLRNEFQEKLNSAQEKNQQLPGVMAIGIDSFIKYNDENGEEAGDMLLIQAANTILSLLPAHKGFSIGRTHGVGFVAIFDYLTEEELKYISTKIQTGFKALNLAGLNDKPMTISIAVVLFSEDNLPPNPTSALRAAHQRLVELQSKSPECIATFEFQRR